MNLSTGHQEPIDRNPGNDFAFAAITALTTATNDALLVTVPADRVVVITALHLVLIFAGAPVVGDIGLGSVNHELVGFPGNPILGLQANGITLIEDLHKSYACHIPLFAGERISSHVDAVNSAVSVSLRTSLVGYSYQRIL